MASARKQASKKVTKVAVRRTARKSPAVDNPTYTYVLSERTKLFLWNPIEVIGSYDAAVARRNALEADSIYGGAGYKLTRVSVKA